jgi:hypothetical protein
LGGGPPGFPRDFSGPAVLGWSGHEAMSPSPTGLSPSLAGLPMPFDWVHGFLLRDGLAGPSARLPLPQACNGCNLTHTWFGLFRVRSPLLAESLLFSLPRGTEMFQFSRLPPHTYGFSVQYCPMTGSGFPHSDIRGSMLAYSSPRRFGVRSVLLRLLAPRHPPCALPNFTCVNSPCGPLNSIHS